MDKKDSIYIDKIKADAAAIQKQLSNPLDTQISGNNALSEYNKITLRPKYDNDIVQIVEIVRILNNLAPINMPEYNFNADEINGERFYTPKGELLFIRDFDNDVIRDYYYNPNAENQEYTISRILEHDKNTGRLRVKIEPITRKGSNLKTNIALFDEKISNKYTIIQLAAGGIVGNISEFSSNGKSFQTLFRNIDTLKPVRYIEGKDNREHGFSMIDCLFTENGDIARIKKYTNKKEINIDYTATEKRITVKNR